MSKDGKRSGWDNAASWASGVSTLVEAGGGIALGFINGSILKERARIMEQRAEFNSRMADLSAERTLARTNFQVAQGVEDIGQQVSEQVSASRVAAAGGNIRVGTGSRARAVEARASRARLSAQEQAVMIQADAQSATRSERFAAQESLLSARLGVQQANSMAGFMAAQGVAKGVQDAGYGLLELSDAGVFGGLNKGDQASVTRMKTAAQWNQIISKGLLSKTTIDYMRASGQIPEDEGE